MKIKLATLSLLLMCQTVVANAQAEGLIRIVCTETSSWNDDRRIVVVDQLENQYTDEDGSVISVSVDYFIEGFLMRPSPVFKAQIRYFDGSLGENPTIKIVNQFVATFQPTFKGEGTFGKMLDNLNFVYGSSGPIGDRVTFALSLGSLEYGNIKQKVAGITGVAVRKLSCMKPYAFK